MLPQQPRTQTVQNISAPPFAQSTTLTDPSFNLDSSAAAKQMAALNVVSMQRQLANTYPRPPAASLPSQVPLGGTTPASFLGGVSSPYHQSGLDAPPAMQFASTLQPTFPPVHTLQPNPAPLEPSIPPSNLPPRHPPNPALIKQKQRSFLAGLATVHNSRGTPLPPALTAVQTPNYDPASSPWKSLECSSEPGSLRLAGKDVDLFKLWGIVCQLGGGQKVSQQNAWPQLLPQFDLPEYLPAPMSNGQRATSDILARYYNIIIQPFEDAYRRNLQDTNRKTIMTTGRPSGAPVAPSNSSNIPSQPPSSAQPPSSSQLSIPVNNMGVLLNQSVSSGQNTSASITGSPIATTSQTLPQSPHPQHGVPTSLTGFSDSLASHSLVPSLGNTTARPLPNTVVNEQHEQDAPGTKRRLESEELDGKRTKLKIGEIDPFTFGVRN